MSKKLYFIKNKQPFDIFKNVRSNVDQQSRDFVIEEIQKHNSVYPAWHTIKDLKDVAGFKPNFSLKDLEIFAIQNQFNKEIIEEIEQKHTSKNTLFALCMRRGYIYYNELFHKKENYHLYKFAPFINDKMQINEMKLNDFIRTCDMDNDFLLALGYCFEYSHLLFPYVNNSFKRHRESMIFFIKGLSLGRNYKFIKYNFMQIEPFILVEGLLQGEVDDKELLDYLKSTFYLRNRKDRLGVRFEKLLNKQQSQTYA